MRHYLLNIINEIHNLEDLSNEKLLEHISTLEKNADYLYYTEIKRIDELKCEAVIRDVEFFKKLRDKLYALKSQNPKFWLTNWSVYISFRGEAVKRDLIIPKRQLSIP